MFHDNENEEKESDYEDDSCELAGYSGYDWFKIYIGKLKYVHINAEMIFKFHNATISC